MLSASNDNDPEREFREIDLFLAHRAAGSVISPTTHGENHAARLTKVVRQPAVPEQIEKLLVSKPTAPIETRASQISSHTLSATNFSCSSVSITKTASSPGALLRHHR
jgi:tryptophan 2,3-dioxygenase